MIITAQPFFNELDLLEIKFEELAGVVDAHLIVESPRTYTGIPKPLYFAENRARFAKYPVIHLVVDLPETTQSPWDREYLVHQALRGQVQHIRPEICIWCDTDEIPRSDTVDRFKAMKVKNAHVDMDFVIYFFDRIDTTQRGTTAKIGYCDGSYGPWRGDFHLPQIPESGWHFDYFGGRDRLLSKLAATSHAPEIGGDMLDRVRAGDHPGIERTSHYPFEKLPIAVRRDREKYAAYFRNP